MGGGRAKLRRSSYTCGTAITYPVNTYRHLIPIRPFHTKLYKRIPKYSELLRVDPSPGGLTSRIS